MCIEWMNQWPTIFFTFKDIDGLNFDEAYGQLAVQISNLFKQALHQIDKRMYAKEFEDEYDNILCYGISFFKKRCLIRIK